MICRLFHSIRVDSSSNMKRKIVPIFLAAVIFACAAPDNILFQTGQNVIQEEVSHGKLSPRDGLSGSFQNAAVSCDAPECADIGAKVLAEGGSVADAVIATLLCMGVIGSQSMGIGGGFFAVMYNATTGESQVLNAREMAGSQATEDMFEGNPDMAQRGPLSVAVPGEMKGYWELYKKAGKLPWARLLQPTIDICKNGFKVTSSASSNMRAYRDEILKEPSMREIYVNPLTNDVWNTDDIMKRPMLARTLEIIADSDIGGDELYLGQLGRLMATDLKELGSILTLDDIKNYRVEWGKPIQLDLHGGFKLHTVPPPSSGVLLGFILSLVNDYLPSEGIDSVTSFQRITEAFKHTYAKRTILGDPGDEEVTEIVNQLVANLTSLDYVLATRDLIDDFATNNTYEYYGAEYYQPDNHGTSHVSIIGPNGDAIGVTSTINLSFGAQIRSRQTGIVFNDEMDDFSAPNITNYFGVPPSPNNFIRPGKRPLSSMSPSIFTDQAGRVRLVIGAAGGTKITTITSMIAIRNLWFGQSIKDALDARRFHHQLYPMEVQYEDGFSENFIQEFQNYGHKTQKFNVGMAVSNGVARAENGTIFAATDFRKVGSIAGF